MGIGNYLFKEGVTLIGGNALITDKVLKYLKEQVYDKGYKLKLDNIITKKEENNGNVNKKNNISNKVGAALTLIPAYNVVMSCLVSAAIEYSNKKVDITDSNIFDEIAVEMTKEEIDEYNNTKNKKMYILNEINKNVKNNSIKQKSLYGKMENAIENKDQYLKKVTDKSNEMKQSIQTEIGKVVTSSQVQSIKEKVDYTISHKDEYIDNVKENIRENSEKILNNDEIQIIGKTVEAYVNKVANKEEREEVKTKTIDAYKKLREEVISAYEYYKQNNEKNIEKLAEDYLKDKNYKGRHLKKENDEQDNQ